MKLANDWKDIAKKAWSFRLGFLAAILSGLEVIVPFFIHTMPVHIFAVLSFLVVSSAVIARLLAQSNMEEGQ